MKLKLKNYTGIMPKKDPKLLPENAAQVAHNVNLLAGNLRPLNEPTIVEPLASTAIETIYDYGTDKYTMTCGASGSLGALQAITNGAFNIGIGGETVPITGLDFSSAADFAACAALIQAKIRSTTDGDSTILVAYSNGAFVFVSGFELSALTDFTGSISNGFGSGTGTTTISSNTSLTSTVDGPVVVQEYGNLIINSGKTLTVSNRCQGLALYINGDLTVNGTISMTDRGANVDPATAGCVNDLKIMRITATGTTNLGDGSVVTGCGSAFVAEEAAQSPTSDAGKGKIYTIPLAGASGGIATNGGFSNDNYGANGSSGNNLQSGGGGSGANDANNANVIALYAGNGAAGTCFSSGTGGGAARTAYATHATAATAGAINGGVGGSSTISGTTTVTGAGNSSGVNQTAGLLIIFVKGNILGTGSIVSEGHTPNTSGGASGGGIILCLYGGSKASTVRISCAGGSGYNSNGGTVNGGDGGNGSSVVEQILA